METTVDYEGGGTSRRSFMKGAVVSAGLGLVGGSGLALLSPNAAGAATGGYPYATHSSEQVDPWGFYKRYCTSFCAWWLNANGVTFHNT